MSLVSTWVRAVDGKYYEEPVLTGVEVGFPHERWFLVFDDEEPPEFVLEAKGQIVDSVRMDAILNSLGFEYAWLSLRPTSCERLFGPRFDLKVLKAGEAFIQIDTPIPVPQEYERVADSYELIPDGEKVVYTFYKEK